MIFSAAPLLIVLMGALAALMTSAFARGKPHTMKVVSWLCFATLAIGLVATWANWLLSSPLTLGMLAFDRITFVGWMIVLLATGLTVLLSTSYLPSESRVRTEYYPLLLLSAFGLCILVSAIDLVTIIIGIEIAALSAYTLVGIMRYQLRCNEASIKYFLIGSFSLAFIIMGTAFIFGSTETTDLTMIGQRAASVMASDTRWFFLFGCAMLIIGLAFKIAAVPFHAWAPDVYDGAPTPITAFIASAIKAAALIVFLRLASVVLGQAGSLWITVSAGLAVITMLLGNLAAIAQENIKRLLAYSAIAHIGYILVAFPLLAADSATATSAVLFYIFSYALMTIGAFAVVVALNEGHEEHLNISSLAGLGRQRPGMAAALTLFLLSLAGFPPTMGFFAKYYLFLTAVKSGYYWLVIIAVINSVLSIYYYLKPVVLMYLRDEREGAMPIRFQPEPISTAVLAVVFICALAVTFFGIFPTNLLDMILHSV